MLHTKFRENRPVGSGEEDFDQFLPYRNMAPILVIFISLYLKVFIQSLVQIGTVVSEKIQFEFLYLHNLGPRSRYDLDLQYSQIFIYSIRCLLLLTLRSLAAIVSEKSTVFTFSYRKAKVTKFDKVKVKVIPGSSFDQTMMGWSPQCYIPSFVKMDPLVLEKKIFEGFLPYMGLAAILVM